MSNAEIRYGSNAQLIAIARDIVASQTAEIQIFDQVLADSTPMSQTAG